MLNLTFWQGVWLVVAVFLIMAFASRAQDFGPEQQMIEQQQQMQRQMEAEQQAEQMREAEQQAQQAQEQNWRDLQTPAQHLYDCAQQHACGGAFGQ